MVSETPLRAPGPSRQQAPTAGNGDSSPANRVGPLRQGHGAQGVGVRRAAMNRMLGALMGMRTRLTVLGLVVMTVLLFVTSAASATTVTQAARLVAGDRMEGDRFGYAVATSGDTVFVGDALRTVDSLAAAGAVYVFAGSGWAQAQRLTGADGAAGAGFGLAVAAQGDTLVVGAPRATENGVPFGAVYVYKNVAGVWTLEQRLMASDPGQMADLATRSPSTATSSWSAARAPSRSAPRRPSALLPRRVQPTCSPAPVVSGARRPSSRRRRAHPARTWASRSRSPATR